MNDSVVHTIELDYKKGGSNYDEEEDAAGCTTIKRASLQIITEANIGADNVDFDNDDNVICADGDDDNDDYITPSLMLIMIAVTTTMTMAMMMITSLMLLLSMLQ